MAFSGCVVFWRSLQSCLLFATGYTKPSSNPRGDHALKRGFDFYCSLHKRATKRVHVSTPVTLRIEGFIMKPCFNLVVKVWFSMSSGRAFQCQGMNAGPEVGGVSGAFGWFVSQIANLSGTTMLRSLVKATQGACQDEISSIQLIGSFGRCKGRLWVCLSLCSQALQRFGFGYWEVKTVWISAFQSRADEEKDQKYS